MAVCIASLFASSSSYLNNAEIVYDSYPSFFDDLKELGAFIEEDNRWMGNGHNIAKFWF